MLPHSGDSSIASCAIVLQSSGAAVELTDGLDRAVDLLVAVRERKEERLELRRRYVDAALEQVAEEPGVAVGVARLRVVEVAHGTVGVEQREHCADALHGAERGEAGLQACTSALQLLVRLSVPQAAQHREARRGGERISGERAGLV